MKTFKNLVAVHSKIIPPNLCDRTIEFFDKNENFDSNIAVDEGGEIDQRIRNSKECILRWGDVKERELSIELNNIISPLVDEYFKTYPQLFVSTGSTHYEDAHLLRYEPNDGFYNFHFDTGGVGIENRILSIIMYLNDVEEGGETEFEYIDIDPVKPRKGDVVIFPSGATHTHKGNMPLSNEKYIAVYWLRED